MAGPSTYVHFKTFIGLALGVSRAKGYSFKFGHVLHVLWSLQS